MPSEVTLYNRDCLEAMKEMPDKAFDLAIVDPVYDISENALCPGKEISTTGVRRKGVEQARKLATQEVVNEKYFQELFRVSKHQIIWGENYFQSLIPIRGRIIWDKCNDTSTFSNAEIAACSFIEGVRIFRYMWNGMIQENMGRNKEIRNHPFQKPVALYKWILNKYAPPQSLPGAYKILDTHLGSGSIAIACYDMGFDLIGFEIDKQYFDGAVKRLENHKRQMTFL